MLGPIEKYLLLDYIPCFFYRLAKALLVEEGAMLGTGFTPRDDPGFELAFYP
jgi:hypothetical protein